ncbi:HmuY family protein [Alteromonas sp. HB246098]
MNKTYLALLLAMTFGLTACGGSSSDDTSVETPDQVTDGSGDSDDGSSDGKNEEATIYGPFSTGSTSEPVAVYFDLDTQTQLTLTEEEAATDTTWDIGFKRTSVFLNTHQEAAVSLYFTGNNSDFYDDTGAPVSELFLNATADSELDDYLAVTQSDIPEAEAFSTDTETQVIGDTFYNYDFTTHVVTPNEETYYIVSSDSNYTKFHVTDIVTEGRGIGEITLGVMHQSVLDGQSTFADEIALTVDAVGCSDAVYVDFDMQQVVTQADGWDLSIPCADGAGEFTLSIADDATVLRTDAETYDGVDTEAAQFYGFSEETVSEYAMSSHNWYFYDSTSHLLYSQFGVYLIQAGDSTYKLQITSYYDEEGASGAYSFRADPLSGE